MGRPLNKKYFGNRNVGVAGNQTGVNANSQNYADDRIGGEGFAGVTFGASVADTSYGSGAYKLRIPTISIAPPTIPGGVSAVATVSHVKAVHAVQHARGTGYQIDDIIEGTTGTGTKARFKVTKLRVLSVTLGSLPASGNFDGGENLVWDIGVNAHWTEPTIITNVASTGTPNYDLAGTYGSFTGGVWDGTDGSHAPITALPITGGNMTPNPTNPSYNTRGTGDLRGKVGGGAVDNNGAGGTATFTYGIEEVVLVADYQGDYTAVDAAAQAVANITVGATGANATLDIYYGVKTITVSEKGSGYTGVEPVTFASTIGGAFETRATGTIVLTTDSGAVGSATNQENAIIIRANIDGTTAVADIIRQVRTRGYKVKTAIDGVGVCDLVADDTPAVGKAYLVATAANGSTYYVTKLTAHRATLVYKSGTSLPALAGKSAKWSFAPAAGTTVQIENA
jgi:hypothetical protein